MKKIIKLSFAFLGLVIISSCNSDDIDTTKPIIEIISPTNDQTILPESYMKLEANLMDNSGLASYKIEIHPADDGHEHKASQLATEDFEYTFVDEISTETVIFILKEDIMIPANITEGHYHVGITVIDKNGNQNQQFVEVFLGVTDNH